MTTTSLQRLTATEQGEQTVCIYTLLQKTVYKLLYIKVYIQKYINVTNAYAKVYILYRCVTKYYICYKGLYIIQNLDLVDVIPNLAYFKKCRPSHSWLKFRQLVSHITFFVI